MVTIVKTTKKREYTPARAEANRRYNESAYTQIAVQIPKETAKRFKERCKATGIPQRQVIFEAIKKFLGE